MKRPKLIVILLASGILVLITGSVIAASLPPQLSHKVSVASAALAHRSARTTADSGTPGPALAEGASAAVPLSKSAAAKIHKTSRAKKHQVKHTITYVVKHGDTLSGIAEWFMLHGYGALYAANEDVIGTNPNLIVPGERITITNGKMKITGTSS